MKRIGFLIFILTISAYLVSEKGTTSHPVQKRIYTYE